MDVNHKEPGKYDVAIVGVGTGSNYGSAMTYYSLYRTIESFGKSVLMISKIGAKENDPELIDSYTVPFAKAHYNLSKVYNRSSVAELNDIVDTFVIGSDQVWNYGISRNFGKAFYLDFVNDNRRRISYAASFGHAKDFAPDEERPTISGLLERFNAISVREKSGVTIARDVYRVAATQVAEPIFLSPTSAFQKLEEKSTRDVSGPYLLAYILDPTPEKRAAILEIAGALNLKVRVILDGWVIHFADNKAKMNLGPAVEEAVSVYDFLKLFDHSSYVLTDSFHGTCFALKYGKPFASIGNARRGVTRFHSLFDLIGHRDHFTLEPTDVVTQSERFLKPVDYQAVNRVLDKHVAESTEWLKQALEAPVDRTSSLDLTSGIVATIKNSFAPDSTRSALSKPLPAPTAPAAARPSAADVAANRGKKVLLVGGTGAMGVYLAPELLSLGYEVHVTSRRDINSTTPGLRYIQGDGHDVAFLEALCAAEKYCAVIDFMVYTTPEFEERRDRLLDLSPQYFFLSSYRVFANTDVITETSPMLLDVVRDEAYLKSDEYALAKTRQERLLRQSSRKNWTILRPSITYSKNRYQLGSLEANMTVGRAALKVPTIIAADMLPKRTTMTWAGDVSKMIARLVGKTAALGEDFNVATAESQSWKQVAEYYSKFIGLECTPVSLKDYIETTGRRWQTIYDRMFDRRLDNSKILKYTGLDQASLMSLSDGLNYELSQIDWQRYTEPKRGWDMHAKFDLLTNSKASLGKLIQSPKELYQATVQAIQAEPILKRIVPKVLAAPAPDTSKDPWDVKQCRILVSILKQMGIKHLVASSGGRNVPIMRFFEANQDFFKVYPVADERSAAYFACGLATKVKEPIIICCTSGTAASNYLAGVTEAFFSKLPLIVITADRHPMYLNNNEDQTVPQVGMFDGVVKKSVALLAGEHPNFEWYAGRLIKEAVLEATHGVRGPVHINVPIFNLRRDTPPPEELRLLNLRAVRRITRSDTDAQWKKYVSTLKEQNRIMVLYGQNQPVSPAEQSAIDAFAERYNCVIVAEHISNLSGKHVINPFNLLRDISQQDFNKHLAPDVLISVGGTQIMNHPVTGKLRRGPGSIRHWLVDPSGTYNDKFFKLTSILECSQSWFFDYFSENAGQGRNNRKYFDTWKKMVEQNPLLTDGADKYTQFNVEGKLLNRLPENSMLHLGIGNTFMMTQRYAIKPSVEIQCNMGVNGIDGSASTFIGQAALTEASRLCFLLIGDMSYFYDMNCTVNKHIGKNIRIMLINNGKAALLEHYKVGLITQQFEAVAEGWVKSQGFNYLSARNLEEYETNLKRFVSSDSDGPLFFEVFVRD